MGVTLAVCGIVGVTLAVCGIVGVTLAVWCCRGRSSLILTLYLSWVD